MKKKYLLHKQNIILIFISLILILILTYFYYINYTKNIYYHKSISFNKNEWDIKNKLKYSFSIKNVKSPLFNICLSMEHNNKYPFSNLFLKYSIFDSSGMSINNGIIQYPILNNKTGKPLGRGLWLNKTINLVLMNNYNFHNNSSYTIVIEHMMRDDKLKGIRNISLILNNVK